MEAFVVFANQLAGPWAKWMIAASWQVAVLAAVVWLVARVSHRASASFRYLLWLLVFAKLILPPSLATPWSPGNAFARLAPLRQASEAPPDFSGREMTAVPRAVSATSAEERMPAVPSAAIVMERTPGVSWSALEAGAAAPQPRGSRRVAMTRDALLMCFWAVGAAGLFAGTAFQYVRYRRRLLRGLIPAPERLGSLVKEQAGAVGLRRKVSVRVSPDVTTPAVFGVLRPVIVLPATWFETFSEEEAAFMAAHELAHVKRGDLPAAWLLGLLTCLYWFHPLVWMANLNARREREMACDDIALQSSRKERKAYASTILRAAESFQGTVPAGAGFLGLIEAADHLLHRIRSIGDGRRARRLTLASVAVLILIVAFVAPMGVWAQAPATDSTSTAKETQPPPPTTSVDEEIERYYSKAHPEVQEYIRWTARTFGRPGSKLWLPENAFADLTPEEREEKVQYYLQTLEGDYGRHQCEALAAAGVLKDKRLLPGVFEMATYHLENRDYDCRPKWIAVAALGRLGDMSAVPELIKLVDHGNQNTRMWARASLARITDVHFHDDKQAWGAWWNASGLGPKMTDGDFEPWKPLDERRAATTEPKTVEMPRVADGAKEVYWASWDFSPTQQWSEWQYSYWDGSAYRPMTWKREFAPSDDYQYKEQVEAEVRQHYYAASPEVRDFVKWTADRFGPSALWLPENAFDGLTAEEREEKVTYYAQVLEGRYGRHLCSALAAAGALKDRRLLPGVLKVATYHRDDQNYDCRPKWIAVAALGRLRHPPVVPRLIPLIDHGNRNTRIWAQASLARLTGQPFGADRQAWETWSATGEIPAQYEVWDASWPASPVGGGYWQGTQEYSRIYCDRMHPESAQDAVRAWRAPKAGRVTVSSAGNVRKYNSGGNGVRASIRHNDETVWGPQFVAGDDATGFPFHIELDVNEGDMVYLALNCNGDIESDCTYFDAIIAYER